ncbi:MAG TPA: LytR C-terminal domain-containing protein [Acidimicrobiales bacterium]|jgi:hypothetical protein
MATDPPFSAPDDPNGGPVPLGLSPVRAFVVLVVFVIGVITLVSVGTRPSLGSKAFAVTTTTTTAPSGTTKSAVTTTTVARSAVTVVVANATSANGLAGHYTTVLAGQGWSMKPGADASTTVSTSVVYYAAGEQAAAAAIATSLGLQPTAVQPLTAQVPVPGIAGIDVVVLAGADLVTAAS